MKDKEESRKRLKSRINRIIGQTQGIGRMLDEDKYCVDILTQIAAVRSALDTLGVELLSQHIEGCVIGHGTESEHHCAKSMTQDELLDEVRVSLERFLK